MKKPDEEFELHLRPRATETVAIQVPKDVLTSLERVAQRRDMSCQALLKLYIGQGLRQDVAMLFSDRVLETTSQVLARHTLSAEEVSAIIQEIRVEAVV